MSIQLTGPFTQIITMAGLPLRGPLSDADLQIIPQGGIASQDGVIVAVGDFEALAKRYPQASVQAIRTPMVAMPGLVDCHTHICFGGDRLTDFSHKLAGLSYTDIIAQGGGIRSTVEATRACEAEALYQLTKQRALEALARGVTTLECKSGYGLDKKHELRMLRLLKRLQGELPQSIIPTCLAAHTFPTDFEGTKADYLQYLLEEVNPVILAEGLSHRQDIFVEPSAFEVALAEPYLKACQAQGFDLTIHGDQFTPGGGELAVRLKARSVDHLEASDEAAIGAIGASEVVAVALPGASLGLGIGFTPGRKLLDAGACLAIASDWNPGSAPMGDLLTQAAIFAIYEKLSHAEVWAGLTFRAAAALGLSDRGRLVAGQKAHFIGFPVSDYRMLIYRQGAIQACFNSLQYAN